MRKKHLLSLIIPCYNEEEGIPHLEQELLPIVEQLSSQYDLEIIFVDDGSTDKTLELLQQRFGALPEVSIVKHETNKNLGAALKTGLSQARGELIATWDSDCTYPLYLLPKMLQEMNVASPEVDIVTVSPYHPLGKVENVPVYRIFLSKSASLLYKYLLNSGIYTHSAMVRVYKREVLSRVSSTANNFLYVPEILIKALLKGYKVKEVPATLRIRQYGTSKMKLLSTITSHLSLMGKIIRYRTTGREW